MLVQQSTVVLITGANTGIGYQTVLHLLQSTRTYRIFLGARSEERAKSAIEKLKAEVKDSNSELLPVIVDLESDESIEQCYEETKHHTDRIDVLINNAGIEIDVWEPKNGLSTRQIFDKTYTTNVTGTHIMTTTFVPLLLKSTDPRLLFLTSGTASFDLTKNPDFILNKAPPAGWSKPTQRELFAY